VDKLGFISGLIVNIAAVSGLSAVTYIVMDEESCFLCAEGSFFWFPQNDMTMHVDIRGKWQLLQLRMLLHRRDDEKNIVVKCWLVAGAGQLSLQEAQSSVIQTNY